MVSRRMWLGGAAVLAGCFLALGVIRVVGGADVGEAYLYPVVAAGIFGGALAALPVVIPRPPDDEDPGGGGGPGPADPPPPPWWPEFEREFWSHVEERRSPRAGDPAERRPASPGGSGAGPRPARS